MRSARILLFWRVLFNVKPLSNSTNSLLKLLCHKVFHFIHLEYSWTCRFQYLFYKRKLISVKWMLLRFHILIIGLASNQCNRSQIWQILLVFFQVWCRVILLLSKALVQPWWVAISLNSNKHSQSLTSNSSNNTWVTLIMASKILHITILAKLILIMDLKAILNKKTQNLWLRSIN